jgi:transcriptional regulator with XRE-family HTH domain
MEDKDKKYKYTKQLLKLAIEESGYTNAEIAKKSRLSDKSVSLVSRWRNGKAQATEMQMHYFIKEYGHFLKQKLEHLFYGRVLNVESKTFEMTYQKLEGEIFFKSQIKSTLKDSSDKIFRLIRLVIIEHKCSYKIVLQYRAGVLDYEPLYLDEKNEIISNSLKLDLDNMYCSDNEEGNWFFDKIISCEDVGALVLKFNLLLQDIIDEKNLNLFKINRTGLFTIKELFPVQYAFYQKLMKSGLQSDRLPF